VSFLNNQSVVRAAAAAVDSFNSNIIQIFPIFFECDFPFSAQNWPIKMCSQST
jgi:hypothetical protein